MKRTSDFYLGLWLGIRILRQKIQPQDKRTSAKMKIVESFIEEMLFEALLEELEVKI